MNLHAKLALSLALIGSVSIFGWSIIEPYWTEHTSSSFSDSGENGSIRVAVDGWVGYFPLCSPEMKRRLNKQGYGLQCVDDNADYESRFRKLKSNDYDFAVATVDSYILNGEKFNYPGAIIGVIDESKGGDAIVANSQKFSSLESLKGISNTKIAFTPNSPSHHLLKSVGSHFDIAAFRSTNNHIPTEGSESALKKLTSNKADLAVLWEPDVSKILKDKKFKKLLGTEDTQGLIVDVLLAGHKTIKNNPDYIQALLTTYFKTLKFYQDNQDEFIDDLKHHYKVNTETANQLLKGVKWTSLYENAEAWYGIHQSSFSDEKIVRSIESAIQILIDHDDFDENPIPNGNPYRLINSDYISELFFYFNNDVSQASTNVNSAKSTSFLPLSNREWNSLKDIGSLKIRAISFSSGTSELTHEGKLQVDKLIKDLEHYPNFRIEIRGHTGLRGDKNSNLKLSQSRANTVLRYIDTTYDVDENRIRAKGFGSSRPLKRKSNESNRAYNYRLPRVEMALVREVL